MKYEPGKVELKALTLINHKGETIDIRPTTPEINIFNNINLAGTTVECVLIDGTGLVNSFPICGDELLVAEFKTPDMTSTEKSEKKVFETIGYVFKITNIHARKRDDPRSETFVLKGVSIEIINNVTKSINKSYTNLTIDKIVKSIHNNVIKPYIHPIMQIEKLPNNDLVTQTKTLGEKSYVFPGIDPFDVINKLADEAEIDPSIDISSGNNFKYFQNNRGWHFTTIDLLLKEESKDEFVLADANIPIEEYDSSQKIKTLEIEEMPNQVDNILNGLYNQIVETIDPITKQYTVDKFNYSKNRNKFTHTDNDKFGLLSKNSSYNSEFDTGKSIYNISNIGNNYSNLEYIKPGSEGDIPGDYQLKNPRTVHKNIKYKSTFKNSFNIKMIINIPGNTNLEVGDIIEIILPEASEDKSDMRRTDKGFGKRYLITSVRHVLTATESGRDFFTSLRIERNNYGFNLEPVS